MKTPCRWYGNEDDTTDGEGLRFGYHRIAGGGPVVHAASHADDIGKASLLEQVARLTRAVAGAADDDDLAVGGHLIDTPCKFRKGDEGGVGDVPGSPLIRLADVEDERAGVIAFVGFGDRDFNGQVGGRGWTGQYEGCAGNDDDSQQYPQPGGESRLGGGGAFGHDFGSFMGLDAG